MAPFPPASLFARLPSAAGRICVSVTGATAAAMQATSAALLPEFPFQELRLDYLSGPFAALAALPTFKPFLQAHPEALLLATCRPQRSGGLLQGSAADELTLLCAAAEAGFPLVDLSLESAEELGPGALAALRERGTAVLLSFHDFHGTGDLRGVLDRMRPFAPDLCKVVSTAKTLDDSVAVLQLLRTAARAEAAKVVGIAMGEPGMLTRIVGPASGSAFTFAAATAAEATAPGQLTAHTLADLYRIDRIDAETRYFGVAGDPIRSSLSPLMHNSAFHQAGLNAVYLPLQTGDAAELFRAMQALPLAGCSVTMPLKEAVLPLLDSVDPLAARIGAVNTITRTAAGSLRGWNTDAAGITVPLERRLSLRGARVLVLGAGGAARAAVFGCLDRGATVCLHNRTAAGAQALAAESGATAIPRESLRRTRFDVLIHATPAGMHGNPLTLPLAEDELHADLVFDLVYNPLETPLLALARAQRLATLAGVEMFVQQGVRQFELWTGQAAPASLMEQVVTEALRRR